MTPRVIRVGIVGCGEIAQNAHLPTLQLLSHLYKVVALCDVSVNSLEHCSSKFGIEKTYTDYSQLVRDTEIDLIMILTADEYHASQAVEAANAGKAVFIEKPMALTREDALSIIDAEKRNKVVIFVGYMRRYARAYERLKEEVKSLKRISHVVVRDIIGPNSFFVAQSGTFPRAFSDFPPSSDTDRTARAQAIATAALGERASPERDVFTYRLLGGLGSHDLSAMRELLGVPKRCIAASRAGGEGPPTFITAMFEYEREDHFFTAVYQSGIDAVGDFDAFIEVIGDGKRLKLSYDTPYVKGLPITLQIKEVDAQGHYQERSIRPTYTDAYTLELESLYASLTEGKPVKTNPTDASQDLLIFEQIMGALVN